jgi:hypothetical protein
MSNTSEKISNALFSFINFLNHQTSALSLAVALLAIRQFGTQKFALFTDFSGLVFSFYSLFISIKATNDFQGFLGYIQTDSPSDKRIKKNVASWLIVGYLNIAIVVLCVIAFITYNIIEHYTIFESIFSYKKK